MSKHSKDIEEDACDPVWWWEQPPSINDGSWAQLLALANPKLSPDCPEARDARRRAELAVQVLLRRRYNYKKGAQDGESFLAALDAATFSAQISCAKTELRVAHLRRISRQITELISFLKVMEAVVKQAGVGGENPRTKSAQHLAVRMISDIWHDLVFNELRKKKNFVEFAYGCLANAHTGVTRNSIIESWDRHVLPGLVEEETDEKEVGT